MSNLLPTQPAATNSSPVPNSTTMQPQISLSPEAKSTLTSGLMASALGGLWFAQPKVAGAHALLQLDKDAFEKTTSKIAKLNDESFAKIALKDFKVFKESIDTQPDKILNPIFKNKTELSVKELLQSVNKRLQNINLADRQSAKLAKTIEKMDLFAIIGDPGKLPTGTTQAHMQMLDAMIPDTARKVLVNFKNEFKQRFPIGKSFTTAELMNFISEKTAPIIEKKTILDRLRYVASNADENGMITKDTAKKALKRCLSDEMLDSLNTLFDNFKKYLPKARFKGAVKWFGLGIAASIATGMAASLVGRKKSN